MTSLRSNRGYSKMCSIELQRYSKMPIKYNIETDIVYIRFSEGKVAESNEDKPGIIIDYDGDGNIVGIEVLDASKKMIQPNGVIYEVA